ncbi:helix-turn-helix transcriptional regulator [Aeromonas enteropelogenes]|uniref:helix-turn-helix transcriptional regulator n=1 Tax=Aeromonas enteropelogenes TaxID=29489 RepID=UPI003B9DE721
MYYIKNTIFDKLINYMEIIAPCCDSSKLLEKAGLSNYDLLNKDAFLNYVKVANLLSYSAIELKMPLFALQYAQFISETNLNVIDKILPLLKSLDMVYDFTAAYIGNHTNAIAFEKKIVEGRVIIRWNLLLDEVGRDNFQCNIFFAYRAYQQISKIIRNNFSTGEDLMIHLPKKYENLENVFFDVLQDDSNCYCSCIIFDGEEYAISYPENYSHITFKVDKNELFELIEDIAMVKTIKSTRVFANDVSLVIKKNIANGERCDLLSVAKSFYMHPRTLQAKLANENCKFADILNKVRKEEVVNILADKSIAIYIVSEKLGFSNSAIFSRAFKSWFNISPSEWRKTYIN